MSSQNIDENALLKYVCFCYQIWGIKYITRDTLKKSRENSPETCQLLTKLLLDLATLQIVDFSYTLAELGIKLGEDQQTKLFIQQFVLAYLSECDCPFLSYREHGQQGEAVEHCLDFGSSRILLLIVGWVMAKTQFFGQIRSKFVVRKFTDLYIQRKINKRAGKQKQANTYKYKQDTKIKGYESNTTGIQTIQKLFKTLKNNTYRIECLQQKKSQIHTRLSKQLLQYNKKNQTNYKIDHIFSSQTSNNDQDIQRQQDELENILIELNKGMKNQQYFWMWLQFKVVENQYKQLANQYEDFEKVQGEKPRKWVRMNPDYLSMYNKQYNNIIARMQSINQYMESIQQWLNSVKPIKNQSAIIKQVQNQSAKMLHQENPELMEMIGTPCFLKLEVKKYCEKHGFGTKAKKKKKKDKIIQNNPHSQSELKMQIKQFLDNLQQLKFL